MNKTLYDLCNDLGLDLYLLKSKVVRWQLYKNEDSHELSLCREFSSNSGLF